MSAGEPPQLQLERLRFERLDSTRHDRTGFHCGVATLDRYLWEHATQDMRRGANTVYVLVDDREPSRVLGYFTLCSLGLEPAKVPDDLRRLLPKYPQVSCTLVGRLAVTENQHRRGLGALLLVHAMRVARDNVAVVGSCMLVVDAIDPGAAAFYARFGFRRLGESNRLILPIATVEKAFAPHS